MQPKESFGDIYDIALFLWSQKVLILLPVLLSIGAGFLFFAITPSQFESQIKYEVNGKFVENRINSRLFLTQKYGQLFYSRDVFAEFYSKNSNVSQGLSQPTHKEDSADKPFTISRSSRTVEYVQNQGVSGGVIKIRSNSAKIITEAERFAGYVNIKLTNLIKSRAEEQMLALPTEDCGRRNNLNALIIAVSGGEKVLLLSNPTRPVATHPKPKKIVFSFGLFGLFIGMTLLIFIQFIKSVKAKNLQKTGS